MTEQTTTISGVLPTDQLPHALVAARDKYNVARAEYLATWDKADVARDKYDAAWAEYLVAWDKADAAEAEYIAARNKYGSDHHEEI